MRHQRRSLRTIVAAGALLLVCPASQQAAAQAPEKLTVRFTWKLKGEYAPLFVALDKGYYKAEGLDVDLAEGSGAQTVLKLLAGGNEKFGYGPAVSAAQAISHGLPVKVVALYQTRAPMGVISFPDVPLKTPKDLEGKKLAISVGETFGDMLGPFCRINHIDIDKIQRIQMDVEAPQPGVIKFLRLVGQQHSVGGQRHVLNAFDRAQPSDQLRQILAQQRLAAGEAQLAHALVDEGGAQPIELLQRQNVGLG